MPLTHTDVKLDRLTINKFNTVDDFKLALSQSAIGENDISIIDEIFQVDWNENVSGSPAYIKNKPTIGDGTLTITQNGVSAVTFSANQTTDINVDISVQTLRTVNHESLNDSTLGDINIHDGFYFPNAVKDYDGNWYGAIVIGEQVWLAENLKTTHYTDGTAIPEFSSAGNQSYQVAVMSGECYYGWNAVGSSNYDKLLSGFTVPTYAQMNTFRNYLKKQSRFKASVVFPATNENAIAKAVASVSGWSASTVIGSPGYLSESNNNTGLGFKPLGAVYYSSSDGIVMRYYSERCWMWTSTYQDMGSSYLFEIDYDKPNDVNTLVGTAAACSVRCISTMTPIQFRNWYVETYGSLQHHLSEDDIQNKEDKQAIVVDESNTFVVQHNTEYRFLTDTVSLTLDQPTLIPNDYVAWIVFVSGPTATTISYPNTWKWSGDDVSSNVFTPAASKTYNLGIWYDGLNINVITRAS